MSIVSSTRGRSPSSDCAAETRPLGALRTAQTFSKSHSEVKVQQLLAYLVSAASGAVKGLKAAAGQLGENMGYVLPQRHASGRVGEHAYCQYKAKLPRGPLGPDHNGLYRLKSY